MLQESLRYSFEKVQTFERWIKRDQTAIALFFDKAPLNSVTFNLNDDLSNEDSNAIEDNFFDFEEFDRKKK